MNLGLSLAGGGIKGAAHIGVIKAFEEENIKINIISGTSSGSIIAALVALGYNSNEIYLIFKEYASKIKYINWANIIKLIYGLIFKRKIIIQGLSDGKLIEKTIELFAKEKNIIKINDINMPLIIPSVNMKNGEVIIFSSKNFRGNYSDKIKYINDISLGKAVRASCSYPGIFEPYKYNDFELIDGGIRENIPWKETKKLGADKVISVVFEEEIKKKCCDNIIDVTERAINILCHELSNYELLGAEYLLKIKVPNTSLLEMNKLDLLFNTGYIQTKEKIKEIKKAINLN